ncbi:MATE family efflux transporter [Domibacillus robiginosus]|uniref:MATE family efflux transporter n=1 Tax=Domibacillus robiginosus TaxID=1071054 RepID=UPI00067DFA1E|nr:MATE family efflux transporter [Domibacillus robiginosus]
MKYKKILVLALPSISSFAAMTVTGTVNLIMVGSRDTLTVAIVGVSNMIMYNVWAFFRARPYSELLIAQHYGSDRMERGIKQTGIALYLCIAANLFILFVGLFGSEVILAVRGSSKDLVREGRGYSSLFL